MSPLGLLSSGERAEVVEMKTRCKRPSDKKEHHLCHAEDMGLREGNVVEMLNNEGRGALLVKVDETRIAIGRGMAMKIYVRRLEK